MGLVSPELSLDLKPSFVPETINGFLREVSMIGDASERLDKVDDFLRKLEEEMKKIEVFKRELPLCMLLLKDAIIVLKQESTQYRARNALKPVLEEFIPVRKESDDVNSQINDNNNKKGETDCSRDKKDWMSSVQLWSADSFPASTLQNRHQNQTQTQTLVAEHRKEDDKRGRFVSDNMYDRCKIMTGSKGFVPMIHTYPNYPETKRKIEKEDVGVPRLSLLVPGIKHPEGDSLSHQLNSRLGGSRVSCSSSPASNGQSNLRASHQQSTARKQRRCWSPELHRRFVDALTQLGGPQVATPKQIRELMQVDGLTNDEVKSHLQKYRLHTRRVPNNSATSTNENGNTVASSCATQDQCSDSSKPSNLQSGSPQGPLQYPGVTGGDSMEDEDDEKSESYSWKGHVHRPGKDDI